MNNHNFKKYFNYLFMLIGFISIIIVGLVIYAYNLCLRLEQLEKDLNEVPQLREEIVELEETVARTTILVEDLQAQIELMSEEVNEINNRWNISLTDEEIDLLARIVMLEAGNECDWGKDAVVEVIFNRIYDKDFPNTLEEVLSQEGQFTTWKNRNISAAEPTEKVYERIYCVLNGETDILPYTTVYFGRAAQNNKEEITIEDHVFCNK